MGDQIVLLRNSERATYRRCRLKWDWNYNQRLAPERTKGALTFGTLVHKALERYYIPGRKRGVHPAKTFEQVYNEREQEFDQWDEEGNRISALELGITMLNGYVRQYGKEDHIEVIHPEMSMQVDVMDKKGNYVCTWVGQGDALVRDHSLRKPKLRFLEHKTAKSIEEELRVNSGYGEQGLSYFWAANNYLRHHGLLAANEVLDGVVFNWLRKGIPDERPVNAQGHALNKPTKAALVAECRKYNLGVKGTVEDLLDELRKVKVDGMLLGEPSKTQPKPLFHRFPLEFGEGELGTINKRIRAEAMEMAMVRAKKLPILKNPTKDCSWDCPYKEACELHEMGADYESVLELEFDTWDPYEAHEIETEKH